MNYGHVGRPTNEEVKSKKRKKLLKIGIPVIAIVAIIGVIASQNGLGGMMGNSVVNQGCYGDWQSDGDVCYKERTTKKMINAYALGDANKDGVINDTDLNTITQSVDSGEQLDEEKSIIYDYNGDGEVNSDDVSQLQEDIEYSKETGEAIELEYICPEDDDEGVTTGPDKDGVTKTTTTSYTQSSDGKTCYQLTTIRSEKELVESEESDEEESSTTQQETPTVSSNLNIKEVSTPSAATTYEQDKKLSFKIQYENYQTGNYYRMTRTYFDATNTNNGYLSYVGECQKITSADHTFDLTMNNTGRYVSVTVYNNSTCSSNSVVKVYKTKLYKAKNSTDKKTDKTYAKSFGDGVSFKLYMPKLSSPDKKLHRFSIYYQINTNKTYYAKWKLTRSSDKKVYGDKCQKIVNGMFDTHNITVNGAINQELRIYSDSGCANQLWSYVGSNKETLVPGVATQAPSKSGSTTSTSKTTATKTKDATEKYSCSSGKLKGKKCEKSVKAKKNVKYSCPLSGYKRSGTKCKLILPVTIEYKCSGAWKKVGDGPMSYCHKTKTAKKTSKCPHGYTKTGTNCTKTTKTGTWNSRNGCKSGYRQGNTRNCIKTEYAKQIVVADCPKGWNPIGKQTCELTKPTKKKKVCGSSGSKCVSTIKASKTVSYSCSSGRPSGNRCIITTDAKKTYKCSSNYTLSGTKCIKK